MNVLVCYSFILSRSSPYSVADFDVGITCSVIQSCLNTSRKMYWIIDYFYFKRVVFTRLASLFFVSHCLNVKGRWSELGKGNFYGISFFI